MNEILGEPVFELGEFRTEYVICRKGNLKEKKVLTSNDYINCTIRKYIGDMLSCPNGSEIELYKVDKNVEKILRRIGSVTGWWDIVYRKQYNKIRMQLRANRILTREDRNYYKAVAKRLKRLIGKDIVPIIIKYVYRNDYPKFDNGLQTGGEIIDYYEIYDL